MHLRNLFNHNQTKQKYNKNTKIRISRIITFIETRVFSPYELLSTLTAAVLKLATPRMRSSQGPGSSIAVGRSNTG